MSSTAESYIQQVQSIRVQDCIKITVDTQFLNANFELIKQCLLKVTEMQNQQTDRDKFQKEINQRLDYIQQQCADQKQQLRENQRQIKELKLSIGDDFMKKVDELENKVKKTHDFDSLVKKLQGLNRFVNTQTFNQYQNNTNDQLKDVDKIKSSLEKCIDLHTFKEFKEQTSTQFENSKSDMNELKQNQKGLQNQIVTIDKKASKAADDVQENNKMMKEINFVQMQDKMRKHQLQTDTKLGEMITKMKKKVGSNDLLELEKGLIEKIDKFLNGLNNDSASKIETKEALLFLEKRINEVFDIVCPKEEDQQDALFARKKWDCASCSKDLGKYEGRLGQFKPWAVFPARQLIPEQTGGYGFLSYLDKLNVKRGNSVDDAALQRLNKTFFDSSARQYNSPPKKNSTKATNFMSAYGSYTDRPLTSLKDQYFKNDKERNNSSRQFRVKRDKIKQQFESEKQRVKQMP